jgi:hypothetical protein
MSNFTRLVLLFICLAAFSFCAFFPVIHSEGLTAVASLTRFWPYYLLAVLFGWFAIRLISQLK